MPSSVSKRMSCVRGGAVLLAAVLVGALAQAQALSPPIASQTPAPATDSPLAPKFAAVSIRLFQRGDPIPSPDTNYLTDPAGLRIVWAPFRNITAFAYGVNPFQVVGGPAWLDRSVGGMYNLSATTSAPATRDEQRAMLRQALAERLGLELVREDQPTPVYALVVAPGGPKLQRLGSGAPTSMSLTRTPDAVTQHYPSIAYFLQYETGSGAARVLGRPLVDETGLTGSYDIAIRLPIYTVQGRTTVRLQDLLDAVKPLGLQFKAVTQAVPVYVVKSVHRPTPN